MLIIESSCATKTHVSFSTCDKPRPMATTRRMKRRRKSKSTKRRDPLFISKQTNGLHIECLTGGSSGNGCVRAGNLRSSSKPVFNAQERQLDKSKTEPGHEYDAGEPDYENHQPANRERIDRREVVHVDAKERQVGKIRAVRNPAEKNERRKIQNGRRSSLQAG